MRVRIVHRSVYAYAAPTRSMIQVLRLTPRSCDAQHVRAWRISVDSDCRLSEAEDAFGNITHTFNADGPISRVEIVATGEVETLSGVGLVRGARERFPPELFLRETPATEADAALRAFAEEACRGETGALHRLHALTAAIHDRLTLEPPSGEPAVAARHAFAAGHGLARDFAQIFIACARHIGAPARFINGYYADAPDAPEPRGGHAWAEGYVEGFGWVGFDPVHCVSTHESHVRVSVGLDQDGAARVRGVHAGQGDDLVVTIDVTGAPSFQDHAPDMPQNKG